MQVGASTNASVKGHARDVLNIHYPASQAQRLSPEDR